MKKIDKIPLGVLKNEEFFQIGDQILVAVENNNSEALKLSGVVTLFKGRLLAARTKNEQHKMHPLSPAINALTKQIYDQVLSLLDINKGHRRAVPSAQKIAAAITVPFIQESFKGFSVQNGFVKREWLKVFFDEMGANKALREALTVMNLKLILDDLHEMYTELVDKTNQRTREKMPLVDESNKSQILNAKHLLRSLFISIETNAMLETALDYEPLITNINGILSEVMRVVKMRNSLKGEAGVGTGAETKNTTAPEAVKPSGADIVNEQGSIILSL